MLKDVVTIKVQGANFTAPTCFRLFDPKDPNKDSKGNIVLKTIKGTLLYGRNGTGKSTIAKAFRKAKGDDLRTLDQVQLFDKDDKEITLIDDDKKQIFVFDEDYVNSKVRLKEDHLDTIVMLGQAAELESKVENAKKEMNDAKIVFDTQEAVVKEYQDASNLKSAEYWRRKISDALRGDDAWAGRGREINGGKHNIQVYDNTYMDIINHVPVKSKLELEDEYRRQIVVLKMAKSGSSKIETMVPMLPQQYSQYDDNAVVELLAQKLEKPILSEREQYLLGLVKVDGPEKLSEKANYFKDANNTQCPYCLQSVSDKYKSDLILSIEKVLSKAVEEHQNVLRDHEYADVAINILPFVKLASYQRCNELIGKVNSKLRNNNEAIKCKINNPYEPNKIDNSKTSEAISQLIEALGELELERIEFNKNATNTEPIQDKLNEINDAIAFYEIAGYVKEFNKQKADWEKAEKEFNDAKVNYEEKKKIVEDLETQKKSVKLALDNINACFNYIFFAEDRLKIEYIDGEYRLFSKGKSVRPCDVSVGERNIIGLTYFFTSIMEGKNEKDVYTEEHILVIDDPVSSYDIENRVGILSFLKYKLGEFLEGNEFTKVLLMTHDLMTFYDVHKILEEIVDCCKSRGYKFGPKFNRYELANNEISLFMNKRQEYTETLKIIYNYANGTIGNDDIFIGNVMRQALEAFATFVYKKKIEDVSTDPKILELLHDPKYQVYFKNLMYRLVLHGGSHKEEQIKAMKDYYFFSVISETEKKKTAKEVLCFIYILNKEHILHHLSDIKDVEATLGTWCNEIKARAVLP